MSKTTLENLLDMLERSNSKKKTTEKTMEKSTKTSTDPPHSTEPTSPETPGALTLSAVNDKLESFGQQIDALLASVEKLHEKVDVLGADTQAGAAEPAPDTDSMMPYSSYETEDTDKGDAGAPNEPDEPGEPGEPGEQEEPGEPGEQDEPGEPGEPDEPDGPGQPAKPDEQDDSVARNPHEPAAPAPHKSPPVQNEWNVPPEPEQTVASVRASSVCASSPLAAGSPRVLAGRIQGRKSVCMLSPDCLADLLPAGKYLSPDSVPASPVPEPEAPALAVPVVHEVATEHHAPETVLETHAEEPVTYNATDLNADDVPVDMHREESYIVRIRDEAEFLAQRE